MFKTVSVVGLGYIGLPTAAILASRKIKVIGVDVNAHAVDTINRGEIHIIEPELDIMVHATVSEGYLRASTVAEPADAFIVAVPTPFRENHEPDLSCIEAASKTIAPLLRKGNLVILESTSPVGATEQMAAWLAEARPDLSFPQQNGEASDIRIAHCPERVLPGHVMREMVENNRIIGGLTPKCSEVTCALYKTFVEGECIVTDARTAEMCKLTENASRDVSIAFANELSVICDRVGINVWELIRLANLHPRVNILQPGPGVGGHCIAVDPWFIVHRSPEEARLIATARQVNDSKPHWVISKVKAAVEQLAASKPLKQIRITTFGLAFKPDIDDLRESPAMNIATALADLYPGQVLAVEPNITCMPTKLAQRAVPLVSLEDGLASGDVLVLLVDHKPFRAHSAYPLAVPEGKLLIDTRGIWG